MMNNKKRHVMFAFDEALVAQIVCFIPKRDELELEHLQELYYTREEFQAQRVAAKGDSRESSRSGVSGNLDDVFTEKNKNAQAALNQWSSKGEAARGLERWANKEHGEKRQQEQFSAVMAVLQAQDDMLYSKMPIDSETLRRVSYKATRAARHYARMMGKADAYAVGLDVKGGDNASLAGMSALTIDSDRRKGDECSVVGSVSHHTDITIPSSMVSLPSLDDDSLDIDLPKKNKDGKRRFRFSLRRKDGKNAPKMVSVHSRA
mmetsp:Transcript_9623/g.19413  ORF Transcript_9623/g.19413 Transcript_9623/m.19413 type:complete len:262 (-) Transcript_9623:219-1004(-)|eukprot:scaffold5795_cov165-Amphora_coffeaeformis.AAC.7